MLLGLRKGIAKMCFIPQRWIVGVMGFLAILNAYTMRVTLSIAITEMVASTSSSSNSSTSACPAYDSPSSSSSVISDSDSLYDWDDTTQGIILSSFYYGYVVTHLPGGLLAERFGGKYTLGLGMLSTAVFTLITPAVIRFGDWQGLVVLRVLMGLGEGTTFPALSVLLGKWVPLSERSKLGSLAYSGSVLGTVVANSISGVLISATKDWASVFYFFGGLGIVWYIFWELICFSSPQSHPFISEEEKKYLEKELGTIKTKTTSTPWKHIFTSAPVWALIAAQIGHDWGNYAMVTDLPLYMSNVLNFNVTENGLWSSLPYVLMWIVSMVFGWICDWQISKGWIGITNARKFYTAIAAIGPGIFMIAASYAGCDRMLAVAFFTIAMGFMGTYYCGMKVNTLDLSPNYAGTIMGIQNGLGAITGIITPYLIGVLTEGQTVAQWRLVFWITFGVFAVTTVIYVIFGSGEQQWWNDVGVTDTSAEQEAGYPTKEKVDTEKASIEKISKNDNDIK